MSVLSLHIEATDTMIQSRLLGSYLPFNLQFLMLGLHGSSSCGMHSYKYFLINHMYNPQP